MTERLPTHRARLAWAIAILAFVLPQSAGLAQTAVSPDVPKAVVPEIGHDFGPVEHGGRLAHTFAIYNAGKAPLSIERVDVSDPGMRSRFKGTVPPGETGHVAIEWDATRAAGDLDAHAVVHMNDPKKPRVTLTLTGVVKQSIVVQPTPDVFVSLYQDETTERRITIVNKDERPLAVKGIRPSGEHFKAELRPIEPGRTYEVVFTVPKGLEPGQYQEALLVDTDHPRLGEVRVGVNIFIKKNLFVSPDVIDFGDLSVSQVRAVSAAPLSVQTSTIRKRDGHFAITSMTSDVPGLRMDRSPAGSSSTFSISVRVDPNRVRAGSLEGSIRILTDDKNFPLIVIPVHGQVR